MWMTLMSWFFNESFRKIHKMPVWISLMNLYLMNSLTLMSCFFNDPFRKIHKIPVWISLMNLYKELTDCFAVWMSRFFNELFGRFQFESVGWMLYWMNSLNQCDSLTPSFYCVQWWTYRNEACFVYLNGWIHPKIKLVVIYFFGPYSKRIL